MTRTEVEEQVREGRQEADGLLPSRDFTKPGPNPMSLGDAMNKIKAEYGDALELLGKV